MRKRMKNTYKADGQNPESIAWYRSHMRSQAIVCAGASREKDGSWTMISPLDVVDHRACLDGGPVIPRHSQQQSDNRHS